MTADLISYLYAEHEEKTSEQIYEEKSSIIRKWSNSDIELLDSKSIIFKQLTDMSKKYLEQEQKLKISYIYHLCHDIFEVQDTTNNGEEAKDEHDAALK